MTSPIFILLSVLGSALLGFMSLYAGAIAEVNAGLYNAVGGAFIATSVGLIVRGFEMREANTQHRKDQEQAREGQRLHDEKNRKEITDEVRSIRLVDDGSRCGLIRMFTCRRHAKNESSPFYEELMHQVRSLSQGETVDWISISLRDVFGLVPYPGLKDAVLLAIANGVEFRFILLDPTSDAAKERARVEEPEAFRRHGHAGTSLWQDTSYVLSYFDNGFREELSDEMAALFEKQVTVRFSKTHLESMTIRTPSVTFQETYHRGGDADLQDVLKSEGLPNVECFGGFFPVMMLRSSCRAAEILASDFRNKSSDEMSVGLGKAKRVLRRRRLSMEK